MPASPLFYRVLPGFLFASICCAQLLIPGPAARALRIERLTIEPNLQSENGPLVRVTAKVIAAGLAGQQIVLEVRLRTPDGQMLGGPPDLPPGYADAQGLYFRAVDQIRLEPAEWSPFVLIPQSVAGSVPGLIVTATAGCGGLTARMDSDLAPPGEGSPPRTIRILGIRQDHQQVMAAAETPQYVGTGGIHTTPVRLGAGVTGALEADGLGGQTLQLSVLVQHPNGAPVMPSARGGPAYTDEQGRFSSRTADPIRYQDARWGGFSAFVPYDALELPPGGQRPVLVYFVSAANLASFAQEDFQLGTATETPPPPNPYSSVIRNMDRVSDFDEYLRGGPVAPSAGGVYDASASTQGAPEGDAIKSVALAFLQASRARDLRTLQAVCTQAVLQRMGGEAPPPDAGAAAFRQEIRKIRMQQGMAYVDVWMKHPAAQGVDSELMATLRLERTGAGWKVAGLSIRPYLDELDVLEIRQ